MTKLLWRLHSWLGLIAGLGLLVIGLTGSILVFRAEINAVLDPLHSRLPDSFHAPRLSLDALFARAREQRPGYEVVAWSIPPDAQAPDDCVIRRRADGEGQEWLKMNPYSGKLLPPAVGRGGFPSTGFSICTNPS